MDKKITMALFTIAMLLYMQLNSKLDSMILGIDSNAAILATLRDRQKLDEASKKNSIIKKQHESPREYRM
ncbi:MAG: hypothetical protein SPJ16_09890 [Helicobacter sp.]|uniref:hypothetical protein n=1 Tax=Helicobacter sp. TaxID=218 RepID=UPI002A908D3F|nr:hypothetical protein [Helicobacter sp.]MDY5951486.1 hypothetical protein [Helicobacter sp.]